MKRACAEFVARPFYIFGGIFIKILKHGVYFSLVANRMVHCPKCHCVFTIEDPGDVLYNSRFQYADDIDFIKTIWTNCPECGSDICLESEVKM